MTEKTKVALYTLYSVAEQIVYDTELNGGNRLLACCEVIEGVVSIMAKNKAEKIYNDMREGSFEEQQNADYDSLYCEYFEEYKNQIISSLEK